MAVNAISGVELVQHLTFKGYKSNFDVALFIIIIMFIVTDVSGTILSC